MDDITQDWIEIFSLCARYSRALDTRDYGLLRSCFTSKVSISYDCSNVGVSAEQLSYTTPEDMINDMRRIHAPLKGLLHRNSNQSFQIDGNRATGRVYIDCFQVRTDGDAGPVTTKHLGWYDDVYVKTDDGWKIEERHSTPVWTEGGWLGAEPMTRVGQS